MKDEEKSQKQGQSEMSELVKNRRRILIDIVGYVLRDIDSTEYKYRWSLNRLVYRIRQCIDEYEVSEIILPEMLNTAVIYNGLIKEGFIIKNARSWRMYDCQTTEKGKNIGITVLKNEYGGVKILLSKAAVNMVLRNIKNGKFFIENRA